MRNKPLSQTTADRILGMVRKQYTPGSKIPTELELADFLGVSRTTIREAVKILCSKNILEIRRGNGTFVREAPGVPDNPLGLNVKNDESLINSMFETSEMLQPVLMKNAVYKATDEDIARVSAIHSEFLDMLRRYREGEYVTPREFRKSDVSFHLAIIATCRNPFVDRIIEFYLATATELYEVWISLELDTVLDIFARSHQQMLDAFKAKDADTLYTVSKAHTKEIRDIYQNSAVRKLG